MKEKKWIKTKIGVGSVLKEKGGEMEENTREGRNRRMRKDMVGCVQDLVGKKILLVQFKDGQKKEISDCSLFCVRKRRLIWMSHYLILPKKNKVNC